MLRVEAASSSLPPSNLIPVIIAAFAIIAVICHAASRTACVKTASHTATDGHTCGTQHLRT